MNYKAYLLICVILVSNILSAGVISTSRLQQDDLLRKEASEDVNSIKVLINEDQIERLEKQVDELEKKWFTKNKQTYRVVVGKIAQTLNDNSKYEFADKYAKKALDKLFALPESEKVSFEDEYYLTWQINQNVFNKLNKDIDKEEDWPETRREATKYYFLVLERIEKSIDSEEEIKKKIGNVSYPKLSEYYRAGARGMSPNSIKDPEVRARYEKELNEFKEAARYRSEQYSLRRIKNSGIEILQRNIIRLYSGPEFLSKELEVAALKADISKYIKDEKIVSSIMEGLENRLAEDLKPRPQGIEMDSQKVPFPNQNERLPPPGFDKENSFGIIDNGQYKK